MISSPGRIPHGTKNRRKDNIFTKSKKHHTGAACGIPAPGAPDRLQMGGGQRHSGYLPAAQDRGLFRHKPGRPLRQVAAGACKRPGAEIFGLKGRPLFPGSPLLHPVPTPGRGRCPEAGDEGSGGAGPGKD